MLRPLGARGALPAPGHRPAGRPGHRRSWRSASWSARCSPRTHERPALASRGRRRPRRPRRTPGSCRRGFARRLPAASRGRSPQPRRLRQAGSRRPQPAPSPAPSLASGAHSTQDPCPDPYAPEPGRHAGPQTPRRPTSARHSPGADPLALLAWVFTPIFQAIFLGLAFFYSLTGDIGIAIILLTILIRILLIPIFRAQIVSQRRMQMLQPELRAIQLKYKGDRARISAEQMQLYKDRGVNPASGCLPSLLQLVLLMPMYQVFSQGLKAPDISSMLSPFGITLVNVTCQSTTDLVGALHRPRHPLAGLAAHARGRRPHHPGLPGRPAVQRSRRSSSSSSSASASRCWPLVSSLLQLVQTRMMTTPSDDPQQRTQQRMFLLLPLFSLLYGAILPAGLFIYWITTTIFSIVQQFLINGYGGLFPLFGWTPRFAVDHTPRFPVRMPEPKPPAAEQRRLDPDHPSARPPTAQRAPSGRPGDAAAGEGDVDERIPGVHGQDRRGGHPQRTRGLRRRRPRGPRLRDPRPRAAAACWAWAPSRLASSPPPARRWAAPHPRRKPPRGPDAATPAPPARRGSARAAPAPRRASPDERSSRSGGRDAASAIGGPRRHDRSGSGSREPSRVSGAATAEVAAAVAASSSSTTPRALAGRGGVTGGAGRRPRDPRAARRR